MGSLLRIPDEVRDSVCFVCYYDADGVLVIGGTAFFVGLQPTEELQAAGVGFVCAVTCKHVLLKARQESRDGRIYLRVNYGDEGTELIHMPDNWKCHPTDSSVDCVAQIVDFGGRPFKYTSISEPMAATADVREESNVGIGDTVFFAGLFYSNPGRRRNIPILRMGTIAAIPEEPVPTSTFGDTEVILIEARSIGGLSGSPVFVELRRKIRTKRTRVAEAHDQPQIRRAFGWAGMVRGHWDIEGLTEADDSDEEESQRRKINTGIAVVVPVDQIMGLLSHPDIEEEMQEAIMARKKKREPTEDIAPGTVPGPEPERLKIDEPFEDAVDKALRKKKPKEGWPKDDGDASPA